MYVLEHGYKWWDEVCKVKCPDCGVGVFITKNEDTSNETVERVMYISEQNYVVYKRPYGAFLDMKYIATFNCKKCDCVFKVDSHIVKNAGPHNSDYSGPLKNWSG